MQGDLVGVTDSSVCGRWCTHKLSSGERLSVKKEQLWFSISANLKRASEMKMSYYGSRVTTYRKAYKGKVSVHCNLFAVARTVASNKRRRNGIAHGWQRKRRWQLWHLSDCIRDTLEQFLQPKKHMLLSYPIFQIPCTTNLGGKLSCNTEAVPPGFPLFFLSPWQSQRRICSLFTSFATLIFMT